MNPPDPLEPQVYQAEVPFVAPSGPAVGRRTIPWRLPGGAVPWGPACAFALGTAVLACLIQTVYLLIGGPPPPFILYYLMFFTPWLTVHMSRPRRRWWALVAALPFFVATAAVDGYLRAPLLVALVVAYTAVTHIPTRDAADSPRVSR
jgi:hypothetical protein